MANGGPVTEVRGTLVRCSGREGAKHDEVMVDVPAGEIVACPECGRRYCRAQWWNAISGAVWPSAE